MKVVINFYDQVGKGKGKKIKTNGKKGGGKKGKKATETTEVKQDQQPTCCGCGVSIMGPFPMTHEMMSKYPGLEAIVGAIEAACNGEADDQEAKNDAASEKHQCNCQSGGECTCGSAEHNCKCNNKEKMAESTPVDTGSGKYKTGDFVQFVYDDRTWDAIIVDANDEWAEVVFLDTLDEDRPMNSKDTNEGGFPASELCKWLNSEGISKFPKMTQDQMVIYPDGIKLRIPTEKQIFGCNEYGEEQQDEKQFEPMKKRRNRVAFQKDDDSDAGEVFNWYWLEDKRKNSSTLFCSCGSYGRADCYYASSANGVRLRFRIVNH